MNKILIEILLLVYKKQELAEMLGINAATFTDKLVGKHNFTTRQNGELDLIRQRTISNLQSIIKALKDMPTEAYQIQTPKTPIAERKKRLVKYGYNYIYCMPITANGLVFLYNEKNEQIACSKIDEIIIF